MSKLTEYLNTLPDTREPQGNWLIIFNGKLDKQCSFKEDVIDYIKQRHNITTVTQEKLLFRLKTSLIVTHKEYTIINGFNLCKAQIELTN